MTIFIKLKQFLVFALTLYFLSTSNALSYANISTSPIAVRQTYPDNTFTEVTCPPYLENRTRVVCNFRVRIGRRSHTSKFSMSDYGYNPYEAISHSYWPNQGIDSLTVAFNVICNPEDIKLASQVNNDNITCTIFFFVKNHGFLASHVEIVGEEAGKLIFKDRFLNERD